MKCTREEQGETVRFTVRDLESSINDETYIPECFS